MYILLCQVFVALILGFVIFPLQELGVSKSHRAILEYGSLALSELVLFAIIGFRLRAWIGSYQPPDNEALQEAPILVVTEGVIFKAIFVTGTCAALYLKIMSGHSILAFTIIAIAILSFGLVFMLVFVITRAVMSRKIRLWGLAGIVSCAVALWFAIRNL